MPPATVLITAFEPFGEWRSNSSWQCLMQFSRDPPLEPRITTRLYPVDFADAKSRLARDLLAEFDFTLHMGQATGRAMLELELFALNVGGRPGDESRGLTALEADGPAAYQSSLPLVDWAGKLRDRGIPCQVSYHAGTYLCNALYYWTHHFARARQLKTRSLFLHVPLEPSQVIEAGRNLPSLPVGSAVAALGRLVAEMQSLAQGEILAADSPQSETASR